ncbi:hypothetical protein GCM10027447_12430 [Glycomyces halotolerans]
MALEEEWLQHTVTVEPREGAGANGPVYGAPQELVGFLEESRKLVRDTEGNQVVSESTFYTDPGPTIPPRSRATLPSGDVTFVIKAANRDGGDLDELPEHIELVLE